MRLIVSLLAALALAGGAHPLTAKPHKLTAKTKDYDISVAYPETGNPAIDADLAAWARGVFADFKSEAADAHQAEERAYDLDVSYTVARNDAQVFAVLFDEYVDMGGAHPNHDYATANYLLPDGRHVDLAELLDGSRGLKRLAALTRADLIKRIATGEDALSEPGSVEAGTGAYWSNFRNFILMPNAIVLHYPPYQVASYAAGPQQSRIPLAALRDVLRPDPRAPAPSFDCKAAKSAVEHLLCADAALARLDRQVTDAYTDAQRYNTGAAGNSRLRADQRAWLAKRDTACGPNPDCLKALYEARKAALAKQP